MQVRVVDWYKWTRFKKRLSSFLFFLGLFLAFGIESSLMYGVVSMFVLLLANSLLATIRETEW